VARRGAPWNAESFESLAADHFARIAALEPELVIFGSGARLRFPAPALLRPLIDAGIGVETMDTAAACRTYNVLSPKADRSSPDCFSAPALLPLADERTGRRPRGKPYNHGLSPATGSPGYGPPPGLSDKSFMTPAINKPGPGI
jgi:hypothetical protein